MVGWSSGREVRISSDALGILLSSREPRATEKGCFPFFRGAWFPLARRRAAFPSLVWRGLRGRGCFPLPRGAWSPSCCTRRCAVLVHVSLRGACTRCLFLERRGGGTCIVRCSGCTTFPTWVAVYGGGLLSFLSWGVVSVAGGVALGVLV